MKKKMDRRTLLKGMGVSLSLPLLECMIPNIAWAEANEAKRFAIFFKPNGFFIPKSYQDVYDNFLIFPEVTAELREVYSDVQLVGKLSNIFSYPNGNYDKYNYQHHIYTDNAHNTACIASVAPYGPTIRPGFEGQEINEGTINYFQTFDAKIADFLYSGHGPKQLGMIGYVSEKHYRKDQIFYTKDNTPLYLHKTPKSAFMELTAGGQATTTVAAMLSDKDAKKKSVLDYVLPRIKNLMNNVGIADKLTLDQYFTQLREIELRVDASATTATSMTCSYGDITNRVEQTLNAVDTNLLLMDISFLAFQCDLTRVLNYHLGFHHTNLQGLPGLIKAFNGGYSWHNYSHGQAADDCLGYLHIEKYMMKQFADYVKRLGAYKEADGKSILEKSIIVYTSGMANGRVAHELFTKQPAYKIPVHSKKNWWDTNEHWRTELNTIIAGQGGGAYKKGAPDKLRTHKFDGSDTQYNNSMPIQHLWYTIMKDFGMNVSDYGRYEKEVFNRHLTELKA